MTRRSTPDAWMQLVLRTMSTDEITKVLADGEEPDATKAQWLRDELLKRAKGTR